MPLFVLTHALVWGIIVPPLGPLGTKKYVWPLRVKMKFKSTSIQNHHLFNAVFCMFCCISFTQYLYLGIFPLSNTSLMTSAERSQFLPVVRTFTNVLENGNANPTEISTLMSQVRQLNNLIPGNIGNAISSLIGNGIGNSGFSGFSG